MWRARLSRTWDWLKSRRLVGEDERHLYYSEFVETGKPERRCVEFRDKDILNSCDRMPVEWWAWLHNRRDTIPTELEIETSQSKKQNLAARVAVLEAEDEKQRLRQFSAVSLRRSNSEAQARRRNKVILRLAKAASPPGTDGTPSNLVPQSFQDTAIQDSAQGINAREDPQVSQALWY